MRNLVHYEKKIHIIGLSNCHTHFEIFKQEEVIIVEPNIGYQTFFYFQ